MIGKHLAILLSTALVFGLSGCKSDESDEDTTTTTTESTTTSDSVSTPSLSLSMPDTLTGGTSTANQVSAQGPLMATNTSGPDCNFSGPGQRDPFTNGHSMTQFLTAMASSQLCLADFLVNLGKEAGIPADGTAWPVLTDDAGAPSFIKFEQNSETQYTMRLYWSDDTTGDGDQYISWNTTGGVTSGKMVALATAMGGDATADSPDRVRVDFSQSTAENRVDVYMAFPAENAFMQGFRIALAEDTTVTAATANRYTVRGVMSLKDQFLASYDTNYSQYISEVPSMQVYTIANADGAGAASAKVTNQAIPLGTLGYYLFTKTDQYYFSSVGGSEYVHKGITAAAYKGGKTTDTATENILETILSLDSGTIAACAAGTSAACVSFLDSMFAQGQGGLEANQGTNPNDGRSVILGGLSDSSHLSSPYPDGVTSWDGVFDMSYTP